MADNETRDQVCYSTSHAFYSGTTSTIALRVWKSVTDHLLNNQEPVTAAQLGEELGLTPEQVENMFGQAYYQKFYGFKRFNNRAEWEAWALEAGVLASEEEPVEEAPAEEAPAEEATEA
ncbi:MAG: hypothetical protein ACM3XM_00925 [Mycobacterium leprae]